MKSQLNVDLAKVIREAIANPIVAIKIITLLIVGPIMITTTYFGSQKAPYSLSMLNSTFAVCVVVLIAIAFIYLDLFAYRSYRRRKK
jgi:membrane protein YdbS with pleckstrin-like domain